MVTTRKQSRKAQNNPGVGSPLAHPEDDRRPRDGTMKSYDSPQQALAVDASQSSAGTSHCSTSSEYIAHYRQKWKTPRNGWERFCRWLWEQKLTFSLYSGVHVFDWWETALVLGTYGFVCVLVLYGAYKQLQHLMRHLVDLASAVLACVLGLVGRLIAQEAPGDLGSDL